MTEKADRLPPPRRSLGDRSLDVLIWGGLAVLLAASFHAAEIPRITELVSGSENMRRLAAEFIRPDFTEYRLYLANMWLTIQMALWGTALAILIAVPLGLAGALYAHYAL